MLSFSERQSQVLTRSQVQRTYLNETDRLYNHALSVSAGADHFDQSEKHLMLRRLAKRLSGQGGAANPEQIYQSLLAALPHGNFNKQDLSAALDQVKGQGLISDTDLSGHGGSSSLIDQTIADARSLIGEDESPIRLAANNDPTLYTAGNSMPQEDAPINETYPGSSDTIAINDGYTEAPGTPSGSPNIDTTNMYFGDTSNTPSIAMSENLGDIPEHLRGIDSGNNTILPNPGAENGSPAGSIKNPEVPKTSAPVAKHDTTPSTRQPASSGGNVPSSTPNFSSEDVAQTPETSDNEPLPQISQPAPNMEDLGGGGFTESISDKFSNENEGQNNTPMNSSGLGNLAQNPSGGRSTTPIKNNSTLEHSPLKAGSGQIGNNNDDPKKPNAGGDGPAPATAAMACFAEFQAKFPKKEPSPEELGTMIQDHLSKSGYAKSMSSTRNAAVDKLPDEFKWMGDRMFDNVAIVNFFDRVVHSENPACAALNPKVKYGTKEGCYKFSDPANKTANNTTVSRSFDVILDMYARSIQGVTRDAMNGKAMIPGKVLSPEFNVSYILMGALEAKMDDPSKQSGLLKQLTQCNDSDSLGYSLVAFEQSLRKTAARCGSKEAIFLDQGNNYAQLMTTPGPQRRSFIEKGIGNSKITIPAVDGQTILGSLGRDVRKGRTLQMNEDTTTGYPKWLEGMLDRHFGRASAPSSDPQAAKSFCAEVMSKYAVALTMVSHSANTFNYNKAMRAPATAKAGTPDSGTSSETQNHK